MPNTPECLTGPSFYYDIRYTFQIKGRYYRILVETSERDLDKVTATLEKDLRTWLEPSQPQPKSTCESSPTSAPTPEA